MLCLTFFTVQLFIKGQSNALRCSLLIKHNKVISGDNTIHNQKDIQICATILPLLSLSMWLHIVQNSIQREEWKLLCRIIRPNYTTFKAIEKPQVIASSGLTKMQPALSPFSSIVLCHITFPSQGKPISDISADYCSSAPLEDTRP